MRKPIYLHQDRENSCVATCVAMFAGLTGQDTLEYLHSSYWEKDRSIKQLLYAVTSIMPGDTRQVYPDNRNPIEEPGVYFLAVPSLNKEGMFHQVLAQAWRGEDHTMKWQIYDPAMKGSKCYVAGDPENDLQVTCKAYIVDLWVTQEVYETVRAFEV